MPFTFSISWKWFFFLSTVIFISRKWVLETIRIIFILNFGLIPGTQTQQMLSEDISKALISTRMHPYITGRTHKAALLTIARLFTGSCYHLSTLAKLCLKFHTAMPMPTTGTPGTLSHKWSGHFVRNSVEGWFPCYAFLEPLHAMCDRTPSLWRASIKPTDRKVGGPGRVVCHQKWLFLFLSIWVGSSMTTNTKALKVLEFHTGLLESNG